MSVAASLLVRDPALDRLAMLMAYLRPIVTEFAFAVDSRTTVNMDAIAAPDVKMTPFEWVDDFSAGRNASLDLVTADWTLIVDPDELPSREMMDFVALVDASAWEDATWQGGRYPAPRGYLFFTANFEDGVQGPEWEEHWHCRLFRTSHARWYRPVHELVSLDGMAESTIRGTAILPKAPRSAYLIHSKLSDVAPASSDLYVRIGSGAR